MSILLALLLYIIIVALVYFILAYLNINKSLALIIAIIIGLLFVKFAKIEASSLNDLVIGSMLLFYLVTVSIVVLIVTFLYLLIGGDNNNNQEILIYQK